MSFFISYISKILSQLQSAGLKIKLRKCTFLRKQIKFFGHECAFVWVFMSFNQTFVQLSGCYCLLMCVAV